MTPANRSALLAAAGALLVAGSLVACKRAEPPSTMPAPTGSASAPGAVTGSTGTAAEGAPSPATGPANGSTAIGGMTGGPGTGAGGTSGSGTPAATGGDGAASAPK